MNTSRSLRAWMCGTAAAATLAFALPAHAECGNCGTVVTTNRNDSKGSGTAGTVIGGVGGALAGHALGNSTTSTVVGGLGGAVAGNVIGKKVTDKKVWSVQVSMDNGTTQNVDFTTDPGYKQGQRVKVVNGTLQRI